MYFLCSSLYLLTEWDICLLGVKSNPGGAEVLEEYRKALEAMAVRKAAAQQMLPVRSSNDRISPSGKRVAASTSTPSSSRKKSRASVPSYLLQLLSAFPRPWPG